MQEVRLKDIFSLLLRLLAVLDGENKITINSRDLLQLSLSAIYCVDERKYVYYTVALYT